MRNQYYERAMVDLRQLRLKECTRVHTVDACLVCVCVCVCGVCAHVMCRVSGSYHRLPTPLPVSPAHPSHTACKHSTYTPTYMVHITYMRACIHTYMPMLYCIPQDSYTQLPHQPVWFNANGPIMSCNNMAHVSPLFLHLIWF